MREAFLLGGPKDGARMAVGDGTSRLVFQVPLGLHGLAALREADPHAPEPILEHRYDYHGTRLQDWICVFEYEGLRPVPDQEGGG